MLALAMPVGAGQVTARQGAVDATRQFTSPMVIDTVLPVAPGFKRTRLRREVADYACDGVSLQDLWYQVRGNRTDGARPTELAIDGLVAVPSSYDREVDVVVTIKAGAETLGQHGAFKISAEEGRRTPFHLRVPISRLGGLTDRAVAPVAEITLTVRDNR